MAQTFPRHVKMHGVFSLPHPRRTRRVHHQTHGVTRLSATLASVRKVLKNVLTLDSVMAERAGTPLDPMKPDSVPSPSRSLVLTFFLISYPPCRSRNLDPDGGEMWPCECGFRQNYSYRTSCKGCGGPRGQSSPTGGEMWSCDCGFRNNYSFRTSCYGCGGPKPSKGGPNVQEDDPAAERFVAFSPSTRSSYFIF